jgi:hypothetical protein
LKFDNLARRFIDQKSDTEGLTLGVLKGLEIIELDLAEQPQCVLIQTPNPISPGPGCKQAEFTDYGLSVHLQEFCDSPLTDTRGAEIRNHRIEIPLFLPVIG